MEPEVSGEGALPLTLPLTKCMEAGDLLVLAPELQTVDLLFGSSTPQHAGRRWEYAMALRTVWESGVLETKKIVPPMALDIGGAGSPLHLMLDRVGFFACHVIDPVINMPLESALEKGISAPFVACVSVIEHVMDLPGFVEDLKRVVTPGGVLFLTSDIWNQRDEDPDKAHWHWMRNRIFTPGTWEATAANFCASGEFALLGDHDFSWGGVVLENWGYSLCSMAMRRRA